MRIATIINTTTKRTKAAMATTIQTIIVTVGVTAPGVTLAWAFTRPTQRRTKRG